MWNFQIIWTLAEEWQTSLRRQNKEVRSFFSRESPSIGTKSNGRKLKIETQMYVLQYLHWIFYLFAVQVLT